jgi:DNA-binding CsgD family transcriptional regulator
LDSHLAFVQGDEHTGTLLLEQGAEIARQRGAPAEIALAGYMRGMSALYRGDLAATVVLLSAVLADLPAEAETETDLDLRLSTLQTIAYAAAWRGDQEPTEACSQEILAITGPRSEALFRSAAFDSLAYLAWRRGALAACTALTWEFVQLRRVGGVYDLWAVAAATQRIAFIAACQRRYRRAVTLLAAAEKFFTEVGTPIAAHRASADEHETYVRQAREAIGDAAYAAAHRRGTNLTLDAALAYAFEDRSTPASPRTSRTPASTPAVTDGAEVVSLTRREQEVANLIARGLSNKEIASTLMIAQRTAESYVEHLMTKLGFNKRAQIAAWVATQRSDEQGY